MSKKLKENFYIYPHKGGFRLANIETGDEYDIDRSTFLNLLDQKEIDTNKDFEDADIVCNAEKNLSSCLPLDLQAKIFLSKVKITQEQIDEEADFWREYVVISEDVIKKFPDLKKRFRIFDEYIKLPEPRKVTADFYDLLKKRRTIREFHGEPVEKEELSDILFNAFGKFHEGFDEKHLDFAPDVVWRRSSPSAGGMNCLNAYVFINNVKGIDQGLYYYDSLTHELGLIELGPYENEFAVYVMNQNFGTGSAFAIMTAANLNKITAKYNHDRALLLPYLDNGHLIQTAILLATSLNLQYWYTAAVCEEYFSKVFKLFSHELPISILFIGHGVNESLGPKNRKALKDIMKERVSLGIHIHSKEVEKVNKK